MPFGSSITERGKANKDSKLESPFLKLQAGTDVVIRILDDDIHSFYRYWYPVNIGGRRDGRPIIVAFNNPIKDYMSTLGDDHPQFHRPSQRAYLNVLDRTEYKAGEPLNKVKILELGKQLTERFQVLDGRAINRADFHRMHLQEFDIQLVTIGEGTQKDVIPSQHIDDKPLPVELLTLPRYDLQKMSQPMPNEAIQKLLDGADYNEVRKELGWEGAYPMVTPSTSDIPF